VNASFPALLVSFAFVSTLPAADPWLVIEGGDGPGKGKHVVLISGDEEYRSEETLPQLAKILAKHHGFKCTVLFAINPKDGTIDPNRNDNIPGLAALDKADLMVLFTRFRNLPDEQLEPINRYIEAGKPIIGLRTATHAFALNKSKSFKNWTWTSKDKGWEGGFGRKILGETWVNHHGGHGSQSTRGIVPEGVKEHPIVRGIKDGDIWGPTDVYTVHLPLPGDSKPLVLGQVLVGMKKDDKPLDGPKNDPMMPVAWTKSYRISDMTATGKAFTTTMGASQDFETEGTRRMLVNAAYWLLGLEEKIPSGGTKVDLVGEFKASRFGNNGFKKGVKPEDLAK
jgi:hypothetical protein